jgi:hypothetical protein
MTLLDTLTMTREEKKQALIDCLTMAQSIADQLKFKLPELDSVLEIVEQELD